MPKNMQASVSKGEKQSQIERYAETHQKILDAAVRCIDREGYRRSTLQRVAVEAGLSIGAVQHHFSNRTSLMGAVVEVGFQNLQLELEEVVPDMAPLETRVSLFVELCWKHCNSTAYQACLQILMGMRQESPKDFKILAKSPTLQVTRHANALWLSCFSNSNLSENDRHALLFYIFSSLTGTAQLSRIDPNRQRVKTDIEHLKRYLRFELDRATK